MRPARRPRRGTTARIAPVLLDEWHEAPEVLEALALNTADVADQATLTKAAGIDRKTGVGYEHLLSSLYILDVVPAWFSNRQRPRLHHLRQDGGRREIDLLIEPAGHRVIAIEIKAGNKPGRS